MYIAQSGTSITYADHGGPRLAEGKRLISGGSASLWSTSRSPSAGGVSVDLREVGGVRRQQGFSEGGLSCHGKEAQPAAMTCKGGRSPQQFQGLLGLVLAEDLEHLADLWSPPAEDLAAEDEVACAVPVHELWVSSFAEAARASDGDILRVCRSGPRGSVGM